MNKEYNWFNRHPVITFFIVVIVFFWCISLFSNNNTNTPGTNTPTTSNSDTQNNNDLNAKITTNGLGVTIVNQENQDWTGCQLGINGTWVALFSSPPYSTNGTFIVRASKKVVIPYSEITDKNGLQFDPFTHSVNSLELICPANSPDARYFNGSTVTN
jgi:hypothetical protein